MMQFASFMSDKNALVKEVKNLLSKGLTQKVIAEKLGVSRSTITRLMPDVKAESSEKCFKVIQATEIKLGQSAVIVVNTESFKMMVDEELPIIYVNHNDIYQIQTNQTLHFPIHREWGNTTQVIFNDVNKWLNQILDTDITRDADFVNAWTGARQDLQSKHSSILNTINNHALEWFGVDINTLCGNFNNYSPQDFKNRSIEVFIEKNSKFEHLNRLILTGARINSLYDDIDRINAFYEFIQLWDKTENLYDLYELVIGPLGEITPQRILNEMFSVPKKYIPAMLELKNYNLQDIKLIVKGGFNNQKDIDFARQGGFVNIKDVQVARKLECTSMKEMLTVQSNGWESGGEMRNAIKKGFLENEKELHQLTTEQNNHIKWNKGSVKWARSSTKDSLERLTNFSSIKSMEFYDFLFTVEDSMFRTDRLMGEYNKLAVPGAKITSEEKFEQILSQFPDVVEVTNGGLTNILINSKGVKKIHPRINFNSYAKIKKSKSKLSNALKKSLANNNLNEASLDSFSWLKEHLRAHFGIPQKEEFQVVDKCKELLNLSKMEIDKLHKARMARNWVGHKEAEQKVEPSWSFVEYCLDLSERIP